MEKIIQKTTISTAIFILLYFTLENFGLVPIIILSDSNLIYEIRPSEVPILFILVIYSIVLFSNYLSGKKNNKKMKSITVVGLISVALFSTTMIEYKRPQEQTFPTTIVLERYTYSIDKYSVSVEGYVILEEGVYGIGLFSAFVDNVSYSHKVYNNTTIFLIPEYVIYVSTYFIFFNVTAKSYGDLSDVMVFIPTIKIIKN